MYWIRLSRAEPVVCCAGMREVEMRSLLRHNISFLLWEALGEACKRDFVLHTLKMNISWPTGPHHVFGIAPQVEVFHST